MNDFIQFKRQREIGEIISHSFRFVRLNYKTFLKLLLKYAGPAFIVLIAAVVYYSYTTLDGTFSGNLTNMGGFFLSFVVLAVCMLIYYAAIYTTIFSLIESYIKNEGKISSAEVGSSVKQNLGKMIGLNIISAILITAGTFLFIFPAIYLMVPLTIANAVLIFDKQSISDSIGGAFNLVKDNWWMSFISIFVIWLIIYIIGMAVQMPIMIYSFIKAFTMAEEGSAADMSQIFDWVYLLVTIISSVIQYVLYSILPVGIALIYFNLNEKKNFTGTYERIENLGKDS